LDFKKGVEVKNSDFLKIALLIILAGGVFYLVTPKYRFTHKGQIRENVFTGQVERWTGKYWHEWKDKRPPLSKIFSENGNKDIVLNKRAFE